MATELAKAYVQIIPSAEGISGKLSSILGREASFAGDAAGRTVGGNLVSAITGIIATAGIGEMLKKSLLAGANVEQSIGGIETLFKDSADAVIESARNAYKTAGMSANEYMETVTSFSASLLQGLAGNTNAAAQVADMALTDMSDNANKMGTSMELIQNAYNGFAKQNYTMLDNLKLGYGGTKTEMQRLLADAQKLTGVKYDMNNLADVYSAIHAIQTEMGITGTTAKEASITFTGSLTAMKAAGSNVLADLALGEDMAPSLEALKGTLFTFVKGNLFPMLENIVFELPTIASTAISLVSELIISGASTIASDSEEFASVTIDLIEAIIVGLASALPNIINSAMTAIKEFIIAIGSMDSIAIISPSIEGIISGFGTLPMELLSIASDIFNIVLDYLTWELPNLLTYGNEVVLSIVNGILEGIPVIIESGSSLLSNLVSFIKQNLPVVLSSGQELVMSLATGILERIPSIIESSGSLLSQFVSFIRQNLPLVLSSGQELVANLTRGILNRIPVVIESGSSLLSKFIAFIMQKLPTLLECGINLISYLAKGILNNLPQITNSASKAVSTLLSTIITNAPQMLSAGLTLLEHLVNGIIRNLPTLISTALNLVTELRKTVLNNAPKLIEGGLTLIGQLISGIIRAVQNLITQIPSIVSSIQKQFTAIDWKSVGKSIIDGIVRGITNAGSSIIQSAKEAAQSALRAAKEALGIRSPSRVFENEVGKMIDMGLAAGIENNVDSVSKSMKALSKATVGSIDTDFRTVFDTTAFENVTKQSSSVSVDDVLDGVILQVINQVTVDGTPLKEKVSQYTINKLTSQQLANLKVKGAH